MIRRANLRIVFVALIAGAACSAYAQDGGQERQFAGKVVIAGSGVQVETAIDVIADALDKAGVPYKVVSGETSRRAENDKVAANGAVSLLYVNSDIVPRQRPKLIVECWDPAGKSIWKEESSLTFQNGAQAEAKRMAERIAKNIEKNRVGGPGLPKK